MPNTTNENKPRTHEATATRGHRDKHVLMLCFHYLPANNGGVERSVKFKTYLPEFGWTPLVLTVKPTGGIGNKPTPGVFHASRSGRGWCRWLLSGLLRAWRITRRFNVRAIYSTSPPESTHLLALALKTCTGVPWVMDLRDPWSFESLKPSLQRPGWRLSLEKRLEKRCVRQADSIIVNTPQAEEAYKALYPWAARKINTVTNGFDARDLQEAKNASDSLPPGWEIPRKAFLVSHAGTFCRHQWRDMTPRALLEALQTLVSDDLITPDSFRVVFAGPLPDNVVQEVKKYGLRDIVLQPGLIPHRDSLQLMFASDLLLVHDPLPEGKHYVHGKLYEYLATGKPILGILPPGASRDLLSEAGGHLIASPGDVTGIRSAILRAVTRKRSEAGSPSFDMDRYERKRLTELLACQLNAAVVNTLIE